VSNLPSREYRQVFGVPDEIFNTVNDLTYYVDQKLQSIDTNEKTQITETSEDHQSILSTDQEEIINPTTASITSNAELDLRYSSLLDRMHTLISPLLDLPSSTFTAENQSIPTKFKEPNLIDVVSNIANEETFTSSSDTDAFKEKDVQASVSTMTDLKTSTTEPMESNDEILTPVVTDNEVIVSKSSEEIATKAEDEEQHQPSLPGLFEIMKNLFPSTLLSKTSTETSLEGTQQQEYSTEDQQKEVSKTPVSKSVFFKANTHLFCYRCNHQQLKKKKKNSMVYSILLWVLSQISKKQYRILVLPMKKLLSWNPHRMRLTTRIIILDNQQLSIMIKSNKR
jgi:hypothetical protein